MSQIKLAIVGSRNMSDENLFNIGINKAIESWGCVSCVISGGARGADTLGEEWACEQGIPAKIFKPNWKKYGKSAGILRNSDIIAESTHILAFPSHSGKGTQNSISRAQKQNKPVLIFYID